jgi:hypothetical protein
MHSTGMEMEVEVAGDDEAVPEAPERSVVLISAGASHSVALLSKPREREIAPRRWLII